MGRREAILMADPAPEFAPATGTDTDALIARHGIVRVTTEHFEYGGYRYSSPEHAIAEAERRLARKAVA